MFHLCCVLPLIRNSISPVWKVHSTIKQRALQYPKNNLLKLQIAGSQQLSWELHCKTTFLRIKHKSQASAHRVYFKVGLFDNKLHEQPKKKVVKISLDCILKSVA